VVRNDKISFDFVSSFDKIILSPGPGIPDEAGQLKSFIREFASQKDILGVCLGHQAIAEVFGATLEKLEEVKHGIALDTTVIDTKEKLFRNFPESFPAARYHSWVVSKKNFPHELIVTARDEENQIMAMRHRDYRVRGIQFHPESILTSYGKELMANWLSDII